jgi:hypothetical protein
MRFARWIYVAAALAVAVGSASAGDLVRNYGAVDLTTTPVPVVAPPVVAGTSATVGANDPAALVAFGHHHRRGGDCCGNGLSPAMFNAYSTWQPPVPLAYANGYGDMYGAGYRGNYVYSAPNPYGYYPNGWYWGSSGPTYRGPFPVWESPSGRYDYRYLGWGSYGWGGWGGTGPAGWGYQGGFYW